MSFIKHPEYEFETTQDAVDFLEQNFGEETPLENYSPVWDTVVIGADVILNDIESKID